MKLIAIALLALAAPAVADSISADMVVRRQQRPPPVVVSRPPRSR